MTYESAIEKFEVIKNDKKRTAKQLEEIEEILSCVYRQNEVLADKMWQYFVDKFDDTNSRRYYVIRLFKTLSLDYASKWKYISMNKRRIEILFEDAYTNTNISFKAYEIISGYIELNMIDEAVEIICLLKQYEKKLSIFDGVKLVVVQLTDGYFENGENLKEKKVAFLEQCANVYKEEDFSPLFEIKLLIYKGINEKDKLEKCLNWIIESGICDATYYSNRFIRDYFLILYLNRNNYLETEIIHFMELFCEKYSNSWMKYWSSENVSDWIQNNSYKSPILFRHSLRTDRSFGNNYIMKLIEKEKWEELANNMGMIIETNSSVVRNIEETLSYLEQIVEEEKTEMFNIPLSEGTTISFAVKIPKILFRDAGCYDVGQDKIEPFCDAIIEACKNSDNREDIKKLENMALFLKNKVL